MAENILLRAKQGRIFLQTTNLGLTNRNEQNTWFFNRRGFFKLPLVFDIITTTTCESISNKNILFLYQICEVHEVKSPPFRRTINIYFAVMGFPLN